MQAFVERQISAAKIGADDKLLVAVSGGVDSVVLLHLLASCARRYDLQLHVAHLDHQIRSKSSADADFVRRLCSELNLPCVVESRDIQGLAATEKISLEMAGRTARRDFLLRQADRVGARLIALAHHRNDQVETLLLRLLRGSGVAGLSAMQELQDRWWRPLLGSSREQILAYARQHSLSWVEDETNADPAFLRNRVRHQFLPQFREVNPQVDERLAELSRQLQSDETYWQQQVEEAFPSVLLSSEAGLRLDRQKLLVCPEALQVRLLREALRQVRGSLQRLEAVHLHKISDLLNGDRSQAQLDLPGCWVARRYDQLWLREQAPELLAAYDLSLSVPGELLLPCGRTLRARRVSTSVGETATRVEFDSHELGTSLRVRNWRPGDKFTPRGLSGSKKIKRLFGDLKLEMEQRSRVPLLIFGEHILWVAGLRRSDRAAVSDATKQILCLELLESA